MYRLKLEEQSIVRRTYNEDMEKQDENISEQINMSNSICWIESEERDDFLKVPNMMAGENILIQLVENEEVSFEDIQDENVEVVSQVPEVEN